jgi:hypothetical protein
MSDFGAAQARAQEIGFKLAKLKNGDYVGSYKGIEFDSDDLDELFDDMEAVVELGNSDEFSLSDEVGSEGESIVLVTINGKVERFEDASVADALAQAKEAWQKAQPKPTEGKRRGRRAKAEEVTEEKEEILPPIGGGESNVLKIDLRAFQAAVRELADASAKIRVLVDAALDYQAVTTPAEEPETKRRGRGKSRANGR